MSDSAPTRLLLLDHYDSFVHNLARYLRLGGQTDTTVIRADQVTIDEIRESDYHGILISPGPKRPEDVGIGIDVIRQFAATTPILGVCLGHQAIAMAYGGHVDRCGPVHGMASEITHDRQAIFQDCPSPLSVGRYHSLAIRRETLPDSLVVTAQTQDGIIMGVRHRDDNVHGVQFHPESVLTDHGRVMIKNFVRLARNRQSASGTQNILGNRGAAESVS